MAVAEVREKISTARLGIKMYAEVPEVGLPLIVDVLDEIANVLEELEKAK